MEKILIIGGGVAGLATGIFAQKQGLETHIFEKHYVAGGNLTGWDRKGCHVDNCVHWLTGTLPGSKYFKVWKTMGAIDESMTFQPSLFYASELNGQTVGLHFDIEKTRREMLELSPEDEVEINRFIRAVKSAMKLDGVLDPALVKEDEKLSVFSVLSYLRTSLGKLGERFKHPLLKKMFSDYIMADYSALALITSYASFVAGNAGLPTGGSKAMADRIAERYTSMGGSLHLGRGVTGVIRGKNNRITGIRLDDDTVINGDYVVFACDPYITYSLLGQKLPRSLRKNMEAKKMPVYSSIQCAFEVDEKTMPFEGNLVIECNSKEHMMPSRLILREYSHEPQFSHEGKNIIQVLIYIHDEDCQKWLRLRKEDKTAYREYKAKVAEECKRAIIARYPQFDGKLTFLDFWTPATYERYCGSHGGAWMGILMPGRIPLVAKRRIKGIENAFLATQWLRSPGGLPNAATGGIKAVKDLVERIERDRKRLPSPAPALQRAKVPVKQ